MANFHKYLLPANILKVLQDCSPQEVFLWTLATGRQAILSKPQKQKVRTQAQQNGVEGYKSKRQVRERGMKGNIWQGIQLGRGNVNLLGLVCPQSLPKGYA